MKDVYRQAAIDMMLGLDLQTEELNALALSGGVRPEPGEETEVEREQNLRTLIEESRRMLLGETEECLGAWGLIDCDPATGDPTQQDTDVILLLSQHAYYVAKSVTLVVVGVVMMISCCLNTPTTSPSQSL